MTELGLRAGPRLGALIARLFERVVEDPNLNDRERLLAIAREELAATGRSGEPDRDDRRQ
jgi:hypothetical protein